MPTIIALDASISMTRPVSFVNIDESKDDTIVNYHSLAIAGINSLLDYIEGTYSRLEFISLVSGIIVFNK